MNELQKKRLLSAIIVFAMLSGAIALILPAHATSPPIFAHSCTQTGTPNGSVTSLGCTLTVTTGDEIIVMAGVWMLGGSASCPVFTSPTDGSNTYNLGTDTGCFAIPPATYTTGGLDVAGWSAVATGTGSITVTETFSAPHYVYNYFFIVEDWSGTNNQAFFSSQDYWSSGSSAQGSYGPLTSYNTGPLTGVGANSAYGGMTEGACGAANIVCTPAIQGNPGNNAYYTYFQSTTGSNPITTDFGNTVVASALVTNQPIGQVNFVIGSVGTSGTSQTQGACPPISPSLGHTALTNSTIFMYSANALGSEVVNSIQTEIASIKGSGSHSLQLLLYASASTPASAQNPLILIYSKSFVITSGTTNSTLNLQVSVPLNNAIATPLPFNQWTVGIVGDDHIFIYNSGVSGMTTETGAASTATQPASFTSIGSNTVTKLALCAQGQYQQVIGGFATTTQTAIVTTIFSTSISTIHTIGTDLFNSSSNWPVIFLILLLPTGLLLGATRTLAGGLIGLMIGAVLGIMMGILPSWIFIGLVISIAAVAFMLRNRSG